MLSIDLLWSVSDSLLFKYLNYQMSSTKSLWLMKNSTLEKGDEGDTTAEQGIVYCDEMLIF